MRWKAKLNIIILLAIIMAGGAACYAAAVGSAAVPHMAEAPAPTERVSVGYVEPQQTVIAGFNWVPIYVDGIRAGGAYINTDDSKTYISVGELCSMLSLETGETQEGLPVIAGTPIELIYGDTAMTAAGRYFYLGENGVRMLKGERVYPLRELATLVGAQVSWDEAAGGVSVMTTHMTGEVIPGDGYYNEDDLYWLSRIINAESRDQPLEGKIGVGNVVLNRVESPAYPDTIEDVVFDTNYGVQFSPVSSGTIMNEPSEEAVIAAKMCLEGGSVVGDSLYFVNNEKANANWFASTRTFVATIGDHDFYA